MKDDLGDRTIDLPAFRCGGSLDGWLEVVESPAQWSGWIGSCVMHAVDDRHRGEGAKFRLDLLAEEGRTEIGQEPCEGEIVTCVRFGEALQASVEIRIAPHRDDGGAPDRGCVMVRIDLEEKASQIVLRSSLRERCGRDDERCHRLFERLQRLLHWSNRPTQIAWWRIDAPPAAVFEILRHPGRWSAWIARATEDRVPMRPDLPPLPEFTPLAFEPCDDAEAEASDRPISPETPWRLIDPAIEGPPPTVLLRSLDPGKSIEFMLLPEGAAAGDPSTVERDPDRPRGHVLITLEPEETAPPPPPPPKGLRRLVRRGPRRERPMVSTRLRATWAWSPPELDERLGGLGWRARWLSWTSCRDTQIDSAMALVERRVEAITAPTSPAPLVSKALVVTAILSIGLGLLVPWIREILWILIPTLLFHEAGHFVAMRLLGYRDVRMFFIPLLGAAVSGRHFNEPGWKAAAVALAGPLPGIALAAAVVAGHLLFASGPLARWIFEACWVVVIVNALNLVPIMPLDGGRVLRAVVAARWPWLDFWFFMLGAIVLVSAGLLLPGGPDWILLAFGILTALPIPGLYLRDRLTARLIREDFRPVAGEDDRIDRADLEHLVERIGEISPNRASLADPDRLAETVVEQYERLNHRAPGPAASAAFLLAHFGALALAAGTIAGLSIASGASLGGVARAVGPDGMWIAAATGDGGIRVWETDTGLERVEFEGRGEKIDRIVFSPDAARVAAISGNAVRIWETDTGRRLAEFEEHPADVRPVAEPEDPRPQIVLQFSPDGTSIATQWRGGRSARIWETDTGRRLAELEGHPTEIQCVFSPDGRWIAATSRTAVRVWEPDTGGYIEIGSRHLAFSPDGTMIATSFGTSVQIWETETGRRLADLQGHAGETRCAVFSPDGTRIATGTNAGVARVWEVGTGRRLAELAMEKPRVANISFSPDGTRVATLEEDLVFTIYVGGVQPLDAVVRIWETDTGRQLAAFETNASTWAFSADGTRIADRTGESVRVWETDTGRQLLELGGNGYLLSSGSAFFSGDGTRIRAHDTWSRAAFVWDARTGELLHTTVLPTRLESWRHAMFSRLRRILE